MRNTSKQSPRDEVAGRDEKFMAAESRGSSDEVGEKHERPFALSFVGTRFIEPVDFSPLLTELGVDSGSVEITIKFLEMYRNTKDKSVYNRLFADILCNQGLNSWVDIVNK